MKISRLFTVSISLLLHVFVWMTWRPTVQTADEKPKLIVELVESGAKGEATAPLPVSRGAGVGRRAGAGAGPVRRDLVLTPQAGATLFSRWSGGEASSGDSGSDEDGEGYSAGVRYAQGMDLEFTNSNLNYFHSLYRKVDRVFDHPEDIARSRIQGHVRIEALLGRDGQLIRILKSESSKSILHAYSLAFLIHALTGPLETSAWLNSKDAVVVFEFDFRTHIEGSPAPDSIRGVQKNTLAFSRDAAIETQLTETVREVFTHYVPPIVPLPGGVYIDFVLAYQYVNNLMHDIPPERIARQRRLNLLQKQLTETIHVARIREQ